VHPPRGCRHSALKGRPVIVTAEGALDCRWLTPAEALRVAPKAFAPLFRPEHFAYDVATTLPSTEEHDYYYMDDLDPTSPNGSPTRSGPTRVMPGDSSYDARTHKPIQLHHTRPTGRTSAGHTTVNVIAMVGFPPASGKSTFFKKLASRLFYECATGVAACSVISAKPNDRSGSLSGR